MSLSFLEMFLRSPSAIWVLWYIWHVPEIAMICTLRYIRCVPVTCSWDPLRYLCPMICLACPWDSYDMYWDIPGVSLWHVRGISLRYPCPKICLVWYTLRYTWCVPEVCLENPRDINMSWDIPGVSLRYAWYVPEIPMICPEIYLVCSWGMPGKSPIYPYVLRYTWTVPEISLICPWDT
jgi:hypothetical protein